MYTVFIYDNSGEEKIIGKYPTETAALIAAISANWKYMKYDSRPKYEQWFLFDCIFSCQRGFFFEWNGNDAVPVDEAELWGMKDLKHRVLENQYLYCGNSPGVAYVGYEFFAYTNENVRFNIAQVEDFMKIYPAITKEAMHMLINRGEGGWIVLKANTCADFTTTKAECFFFQNYTEMKKGCYGRTWNNTKAISWFEIFGTN
jgi:hypothetical protein